MEDGANAAVAAGMLVFGLVMMGVGLAVFIFLGYCFKLIAEKTGHSEDTSLWWLPIVNLLIPIRIAGKPGWWLLLYFIPGVNFIINIIVWVAVAEARGKESYWGIIAALVSIVGIPYLAFSDGNQLAFDAE